MKHQATSKIIEANLYLISELKNSVIKMQLSEIISVLLDGLVSIKDSARYLKDKYRDSIPDWHSLSDH